MDTTITLQQQFVLCFAHTLQMVQFFALPSSFYRRSNAMILFYTHQSVDLRDPQRPCISTYKGYIFSS